MMRVLDQHWCVYCEEVNGVTGVEFTIHMNERHQGWDAGLLNPIPFRHERYHPEIVHDCVKCLQKALNEAQEGK